MERARPSRSCIPTFVGSTGGRLQSPGQEKREEGFYLSSSKEDGVTSQFPSGRDKSGHSSPRLQRSGHHMSNGPEGHTGRAAKGHEYNDRGYDVGHGGHSHAPKHRPPTGRPHVTYAHIKRNDLYRYPQVTSLERSVIGSESTDGGHYTQTLSLPQQLPADRSKSDAIPTNLGTQGSNSSAEPNHLSDATESIDRKCCSTADVIFPHEPNMDTSGTGLPGIEISTGAFKPTPTVPGDNPSINTCTRLNSSTRADTGSFLAGNEITHGVALDKDGSTVNDSHNKATTGPVMDVDYPIRGTISPLTNKVAVKKSIGPVDEVSFVFGRPASPTNDQEVRCCSPQIFTNPGIAKCMTPSPGRYMSGHYSSRPLSPSSDVLPRRRGVALGAYPDRRVLSPPPLLGVGAAAEPRIHHQRGICCEHCNGCLVELKRQALRLMFPDSGSGGHLAQSIRVDNIGDRLALPEGYERWYSRTGQCGVCGTPLGHLKHEAVAMIQSIQLAQTSAIPTSLPALVGSCGVIPQQRSRCTTRQGKPPSPYASSLSVLSSSSPSSSMPLVVQAQAYLEQNVRAYINPKKYSQVLSGRHTGAHYDSPCSPGSLSDASGSSSSSSRPPVGHLHHHNQQSQQWPGYAHIVSATHAPGPHHVPFRGGSSSTSISSPTSPPPVPSAAVSFFARAAQKLGKKKKRHHSQEQEALPSFPTNFSDVIRLTPPPAPPCLLRTVGRLQNPGMGKVKVMLKICNPVGSQGDHGTSFLSADPRKKQVTVFDPSVSGYVTSANRKAGTSVPKMFAFDSVFTPDDSLTELCASSLAEIVQAVVAGADGCLFTYGYSKLGKTYTMIGSDQSPSTLGVMPCAIAWLFKLINEQKDKTGARFSVRVSAVQVTGKEEALRDLLTEIAQGAEAAGVGTAPSVFLREDPICGTQLENQSELRAPTADKAAFYLDAALASRVAADEDEARSSHLLFTLNVYQYRIEKANTKAGLPGVAGGRSRLHLIDLGTASKSKDPNNVSLSLSALGNVIMALLNGQRHVPHRDSKIAQLLRDSLGNLSCRTCMIAHVSSAVPHYNETLQVIQLAARIHRMKRRRTKFSSTSSEDSSTDGEVKFRRPYRGLRMGTLREDVLYSSSHSDPDYTSSSEQSCDTVIYIGANGQSLSDRELTDNEGPPRHVPRTNPRLPRRPSGSRSSGDDSDSGRSMRSVRSLESRLPVRSLMSPPPMGPSKSGNPSSMPGSPNPGLVKMGHIVGLYGKNPGSADSHGGASEGGSPGLWQEKPVARIHCHASQSKLAKAIHEKQQPLEGELWIDGPGATMFPEPSSNEMWVDGPPAFVVQQQPQSVLSSTPSSQHHHHRSDSSSRRVATKKVDAEEHWVDGPKEMLTGTGASQPMHTCSKTDHSSKLSYQTKASMLAKGSEKVLKQALVKHIMETKDRPDTSMGLETDSSSVLEDSSSVTFLAGDELSKGSNLNKDKPDCSNPVISNIKQVDASSSPMLSTKKLKLSESSKKAHSSIQSTKPSQSLASKCSKVEASLGTKLQRSQLPSSASPTHRVVQWIKSVSSEQHELTESGLETKRSEPSGQQPVLPLCGVITMADAETNTEHDSDFERMAEENGVRSDSEEDVAAESTAGGRYEHFNSGDGMILETSMDSSYDTSALNQESIYEEEVEECLEHMKTKDGSRLAAEVDNETFSSISCSNKDPDELDRDHCNPEMESLLVQHTKALTESKLTAQLARHLAHGHHKRNVSPGSSDYSNEALEVFRPLLSRKPDGASNPNLQKIFFEEDSASKGRISGLQSVEAMFVSASHNDSGVDFTTTSTKSCTADVDDEDSFCNSDIGLQSLCAKGDGNSTGYLSSPKLGAKNKPPLPTKTSPTQKHNSANSSPSRSIYCTAKPARQAKDSQSVQQKTSPSSKVPSAPMSNLTIRNKTPRNDKTGSTSSGISHSPQSSVTSSPLASTTSKSSCSSPALKASSKSHTASTSKLPSFCSSRTSSPSTKDSGKSRKKEKEKDVKGGGNNRSSLFSDHILKGKGNDSDSGNDSGIVAHEKRLLSPYATVTKPRTPSHSSSGHGSDNSTISTEVHPGNSRPCTKAENLHGGTSSGYESMLRDSEATGSSSGHDDSGSESSSEHKKGSKRKGTRRSRSAPAAGSPESSPVSSQPSQAGSRSASTTHRAWVDTRHLHKVKDEPLELKRYDPDEVERLGRRRTDDEVKVPSDIKQKSGSSKLDEINRDTSESKDRIDMERNGWSFDCKFLMCFSCKSRQRGTDV